MPRPPHDFQQTPFFLLRHGLLNRIDQLASLKWFAQISNATCRQRQSACGLIVEGGHENDRKRATGSLELMPQFNSGHAAKVDVQEEAIDLSRGPAIEEFLSRCKHFCCNTMRVQQVLGGPEHTRIVIHDRYDLPPLAHGYLKSRLIKATCRRVTFQGSRTFMTERMLDGTCP